MLRYSVVGVWLHATWCLVNQLKNQWSNTWLTPWPDDEMAAKIKEVEKKSVQDLTELDRILLLSKPRNGELTTAYVRIRESQEFKVSNPLDWTGLDISR